MSVLPHASGAPVLQVADLEIEIRGAHGSFAVVSDMNLSVRAGETLCIVGESGCGKSMTALALLRLLPEAAKVASGKILIDGKDFLAMNQRQVEDFRGEQIAMIFQEPLTALNPVLKIGEQIAEAVRQHRKCSHKQARARAVEALQLVQMPDPERRAGQFPHELSGGMRQRVLIASAFALEPRLIVADEPTTALDVTVQKQILRLIRRMQEAHGTAVLFVTHDLGVVAQVCDQVTLLLGGRIVESGAVSSVFASPSHPYTRALIEAVPRYDRPQAGLRPVPPDVLELVRRELETTE